jgi:hypothetical protein
LGSLLVGFIVSDRLTPSTPSGFPLRCAGALIAIQPPVRPSPTQADGGGSGWRGGFPVEGDVTYGHRTPSPGARTSQGVLNAEAGEPIGEVADCFGVVEVRLPHPPQRPSASDDESLWPIRIGGDSKTRLVDRRGAQHQPSRFGTGLGRPVQAHGLAESEAQFP